LKHALIIGYRGGAPALLLAAALVAAKGVTPGTGDEDRATAPATASSPSASPIASPGPSDEGPDGGVAGTGSGQPGAANPDAVALVFPVAGAGPADIIGGFGDAREGGRRSHRGIDIRAPVGTPVLAPAAGKVERVEHTRAGGRVVWLRDDAGAYLYYHAHLQSVAVQRGQQVDAGEVLGTVGQTGNAAGTAPHLHFGIYHGRDILDPAPLLAVRAAIGARLAGPRAAAGTDALRVRLDGAALRSAPGGGSLVAILRRDQRVTVFGQADGHLRVRHGGHEGYMAEWLLRPE
jgi:murein DD-endopeptidase MepM/ murein hydrolase activator NlpD